MKNLVFETRNIETIEDYLFYTPIYGINIYGRHSILYKDNFTITYVIYKMDRFGMLTYPNINNNFILKYFKIP